MLRRLAVGCALLILSTASLMAAEGFDADARALQKTLQADTLQASDLPPFENLPKAAGTDAQRATAHLLMAQALQKASQFERAFDEWNAYAELQRKINQPEIGPSVYGAELAGLQCLGRMNPMPAEKMCTAAEAAVAALHQPPLTAEQKMNLVRAAARGVEAAHGADAVIPWLQGLAGKATDDVAFHAQLVIEIGRYQWNAHKPSEAIASYQKVIDDPQTPPLLRGQALESLAISYSRIGRGADALDLYTRMFDEFARAAQSGMDVNNELEISLWSCDLAIDMGEYARAQGYIDAFMGLTKNPGLITMARQQLGRLRAAEGRYADAEAVYSDLMASATNTRVAGQAQLKRAFIVYQDLKDPTRGLPLVEAALKDEKISVKDRADAVMGEAKALLTLGQRDAAFEWYARVEKLRGDTVEVHRQSAIALVAMGRIAESRGDTATAKEVFQRALGMTDGDNFVRVQARDELESIEYFE